MMACRRISGLRPWANFRLLSSACLGDAVEVEASRERPAFVPFGSSRARQALAELLYHAIYITNFTILIILKIKFALRLCTRTMCVCFTMTRPSVAGFIV